MRAPALLMTLVFLGTACASAIAGSRVDPGARTTDARTVQAIAASQHPNLAANEDVREVMFTSAALARAMPYLVYLPPGYAATARRYPVLYMLHGMGGSDAEWGTYGIFDTAERLIRRGELVPMIIVLPEGARAYWVDHAAVDKEAWGRYMAQDVVADVDAHFRTLAQATDRAIGGDSMGAHGALQLALNYPGTFSVVGAHSLVLRRFGSAPAYFGGLADYQKRDPMQLVQAKADLARGLDLWIDIGDKDPWAPLAQQFHDELSALRIEHAWHEWPGEHTAAYWRAHLVDYLRFYSGSLAAHMRADATRALN